MRRLPIGALLAACGEPCHPDLHPAVIVEMPGRACDAVFVLLGRPDAPTLKCAAEFKDATGCTAWCGRAGLVGPALVRVQAGDETVDVALQLDDARCPEAPDARIVIPPPI